MLDINDQELRAHIKRGAHIELARRRFYEYARLMAPDFYTADRKYLKEICDELQAFIGSDYNVLILNMPPRFGKSRTVGRFTEWAIGKNPSTKIMIGTYNEIVSTAFSKVVRNNIDEQRFDRDRIVFSDVFSGIKIKKGDAAANLWSIDGQHATYLATSPTGTATSFGCDFMIIDDLVKNAEEALNETTLDKAWAWFTDTMISRFERGVKLIVIMTRWSSKDLSGRIIANSKEFGWKVKHLKYTAIKPNGKMFCPSILSAKNYKDKTRAMSADIASANYMQEPLDLKGRLYSAFKTYERIPVDRSGNWLFEEVKNYTDTADEGSDYLCSIDYGIYQGFAFVLDVLYTKEPMEKTEPAQAKMMTKDHVMVSDIESNNGGRGYARSVQRLLENGGNTFTSVHWFHQSKNKRARILSNATLAMERVIMPAGWENMYNDFYKALCEYVRDGKNTHDDAADALTGICERMSSPIGFLMQGGGSGGSAVTMNEGMEWL